MRDWIAGAMLVLGTLLVLAGAAVVVLKAVGNAPDAEPEPGSDLACLAAGYACVTPLQAPCEAGHVDTAGLATTP